MHVYRVVVVVTGLGVFVLPGHEGHVEPRQLDDVHGHVVVRVGNLLLAPRRIECKRVCVGLLPVHSRDNMHRLTSAD